MCFYHVQNEKGESAARPNVYMLPVAPSQRPTLSDVTKAFPLGSTGTFQFRFRVKIGESFGYLDVTDPSEQVPLTAGHVHAKVLRLGTCRGFCSLALPTPQLPPHFQTLPSAPPLLALAWFARLQQACQHQLWQHLAQHRSLPPHLPPLRPQATSWVV